VALFHLRDLPEHSGHLLDRSDRGRWRL